MKKKDEEEKIEEMHQHEVAQMIKSAEESASLLHKISKPTAWSGGAQILVNEGVMRRCRMLRRSLRRMRKMEEALPRQKECHVESVEIV